MGNQGCVGQTITDREVIRMHDQHITVGCRQGATRTVWKTGTDAAGRPVRWQIKQHAECG
jgi:hypothetical protein